MRVNEFVFAITVCCSPSDSDQEPTVQNDHRTHVMNCDSPWLVAVATGGFICVPEQEVNEVHPTMRLKRRTTLSDGFKVEEFLGFSEEKLILKNATTID